MKARRLTSSSVVVACALLVTLTARAQAPPASLRELAQDLATRIAAVVAPLEGVRLDRVNPDSPNARLDRAMQPEIVAQLRARGLTLVANASDSSGSVRFTCSENLRDLVCAAEVAKGDVREIVVASRPREAAAASAATVAALDVRPVLSEAVPILDLLELNDRLLVLDAAGLQMYQRDDAGWKQTAARAISWAAPRDPRGRLAVNGGRIDAFLPGIVCRVTVDPFQVACDGTAAAWPVGVPASTMTPGANYFTSPNVPAFFTAAPIDGDTVSGWLLAAVDGSLHVLDAGFADRGALPGAGDDIASVRTGCSVARQVIAAVADGGERDPRSLRAFAMTGDRLVAVTPAVAMPGRITALWEVAGKPYVLAVARRGDTGRYEAFYVGLACAR